MLTVAVLPYLLFHARAKNFHAIIALQSLSSEGLARAQAGHGAHHISAKRLEINSSHRRIYPACPDETSGAPQQAGADGAVGAAGSTDGPPTTTVPPCERSAMLTQASVKFFDTLGDMDAAHSCIILQARWRAHVVRKKHERKLMRRRLAYLHVDWPILLLALTFTICNIIFTFVDVYLNVLHRGATEGLYWLVVVWPFFLLLPATQMLLNATKQQVQYSFAHVVFYIAALIPILEHTAQVCARRG